MKDFKRKKKKKSKIQEKIKKRRSFLQIHKIRLDIRNYSKQKVSWIMSTEARECLLESKGGARSTFHYWPTHQVHFFISFVYLLFKYTPNYCETV